MMLMRPDQLFVGQQALIELSATGMSQIKLKRLTDFRCQVCEGFVETAGGPYAEAAHIRPLGRPHDGPDVKSNILCLCPNHHKSFDMGGLFIEDDLTVRGTSLTLTTQKAHPISIEHLRYHRTMWGQP